MSLVYDHDISLDTICEFDSDLSPKGEGSVFVTLLKIIMVIG